jgi:ferredoxin
VKRLGLGIAILSAAAAAAGAAERFPPPEFESGYRLPQTAVPLWRGAGWEYVDVAVLAAALAGATVLALVVRSRTGTFLLMLAALGYFGFFRKGCICPIGAIQNVAESLANPGVVVPLAVVLFFLLPLVTALLFGRTFCAAVCPLGAVQDAVLTRPVRVPAAVEHALGLVPYVYLGLGVVLAATQTMYLICEYDPFVSIFRLVDLPLLKTTGSVRLLVLAGLFLALSVFVGRPYCRYLCPYGALLRLCSRVSWRHVTITPAACVRCSLCEDSCPFGAIRVPTAPRRSADRTAGKGRLALVLALVPVFMVAGGAAGWALGRPMANLHRTLKLLNLVRQEEAGLAPQGSTDETEAFWGTGRTVDELAADARRVRERFQGRWRHFVARLWTGRRYKVGMFVPGAAAWFGVYVGLVVGAKLAHLSVRRRRLDYEPDRATCLSCARCFKFCPVEKDANRFRISDSGLKGMNDLAKADRAASVASGAVAVSSLKPQACRLG